VEEIEIQIEAEIRTKAIIAIIQDDQNEIVEDDINCNVIARREATWLSR